MKRSIIKTLVLVALVLVFALSFISPSAAQKAPKSIVLKGTYAVIGHDVCVGHWKTPPTPIPPNPTPPDFYWTRSSNFHGTTIFDGTTTGTTQLYQLSMTHPIYTPIPAYSFWEDAANGPHGSTVTAHVTSTVDFTIDPVTRFMTRTISNGAGTFIAGTIGGQPAAGKTFTFTGYDLNGYVSLDLGTIIGSSAVSDPDQGEDYKMTVTIKNSDGTTFAIQEDICQRTRVSTKIK